MLRAKCARFEVTEQEQEFAHWTVLDGVRQLYVEFRHGVAPLLCVRCESGRIEAEFEMLDESAIEMFADFPKLTFVLKKNRAHELRRLELTILAKQIPAQNEKQIYRRFQQLVSFSSKFWDTKLDSIASSMTSGFSEICGGLQVPVDDNDNEKRPIIKLETVHKLFERVEKDREFADYCAYIERIWKSIQESK